MADSTGDCLSQKPKYCCMGIAKLTWMCLKRMLVLRGLSGSDLGTSAAGTYMRWKLSHAVLLGFTALARAVRKSCMFTHPKVCLPAIVTLNRSTCVRRHGYGVLMAYKCMFRCPNICLPLCGHFLFNKSSMLLACVSHQNVEM